MDGLYSPKGYDQNDRDIAAFVVISGGPRLLHVLHQTSGLPSLSTAYREIDAANDLKDLRLTASHTNKLGKLIIQNTAKIVEEKEKSAWSLKVDEIALEKRLRYNSKSNEIIGLCASS